MNIKTLISGNSYLILLDLMFATNSSEDKEPTILQKDCARNKEVNRYMHNIYVSLFFKSSFAHFSVEPKEY